MARFRAYSSDSDEEEEEKTQSTQQQLPAAQHASSSEEQEEEEESEEESESESESSSQASSSSEMLEEELSAPKPTKNALVVDDDGEYHYAHEMDEDSAQEDEDEDMEFSQPKSSIIPRAQAMRMDSQRMHVMQASLFHAPGEVASLHALDKQPTALAFHKANRLRSRKHSRESDGDHALADARERASFAHDVELHIHRPSRKYARVQSSSSTVVGHEASYVDSGLSMGRSFRVGWGPGGTLAHSGSLSGPRSSSQSANSSTISYTSIPITPPSTTAEVLSKLLQHHLSHSQIEFDEEGIPFSYPSTSGDLAFGTFAALFPTTDPSYTASLFRLGEALFDDLHLGIVDSITPDLRRQVTFLARRAALSKWLEQAVSSSIETSLLTAPLSSVPFTLLTGHQVEKAIEAAINAGNVKLATLISQAGGDELFKEHLYAQLQIWKEQKADVLIDENIRKVYALLAGMVETEFGLDIVDGLDWKRALGLHLWYADPMDMSVGQVFEEFERLTHHKSPPTPWYSEQSSNSSLVDGLYSLIRLHADPSCSLSLVLSPLSFGPSPVDFALPWHLYIIMSRCMRVRDFTDRGDPGVSMSDDEDVERAEGHSPTADLLASSYALQLEQLGLYQEALFVMLHIEGSRGREKAIKDLLARCGDKIDDWMISGVVGSLKIPLEWVREAQATYAVQRDEIYEAYDLYIQAKLYNHAHDLAVGELAPDAIIRGDLSLLREMFLVFVDKQVDSWHSRGKVFLDYVDILTRLPTLSHRTIDTVPDATEATQIEDLTRTVPRLISLLPDIFASKINARHKVAVHEMTAALVKVVDRVRPLILSQAQLPLVDEASKTHIQSMAVGNFMKSIAAAS